MLELILRRREARATRIDTMPIYEYRCRGCGHEFEELILPGTEPACPSCKSADLERLLSMPALKSQSTHGKAMRAAKKRDAAQGKERMHAQLQYEKSHDRHG
jgi:putative FmdB family regulatory protein